MSKQIERFINQKKIFDKNSYYTNIKYEELIDFVKENTLVNYKKEYFNISGEEVIKPSYTYYEDYKMVNVSDNDKNKVISKIKDIMK